MVAVSAVWGATDTSQDMGMFCSSALTCCCIHFDELTWSPNTIMTNTHTQGLGRWGRTRRTWGGTKTTPSWGVEQ